MTETKRMLLMTNIYCTYLNDISIMFINEDGVFYSYIKEKIICLPQNTLSNPTEWNIFAFLHEIGHIITNNESMKRYYQEYLATQWAIEESKRRGFKVPKRIINTYQNYIWDWRERSIKLKGKNVCSKEDLVLIA